MKYYDDIKKRVEREYHGSSLYLKKIIYTFSEQKIELLLNLPSKRGVEKIDDKLECVVLDAFTPEDYLDEGQRRKTRLIVACPSIERLFYMKVFCDETTMLQKAFIQKFSTHPQFSRIKIHSKNFITAKEHLSLKSLKFMFFLPDDADVVNNSIMEYLKNFYTSNLMPDIVSDFYTRSVVNYFIMPLRILKLERDNENLHQLILKCSDWRNKELSLYVTTKTFKSKLNCDPEDLVAPIFIRALVLQEFCEPFKQILSLEPITEPEFLDDSSTAFSNFRKKIGKSTLDKSINLKTDNIYDDNEYYYYKPDSFDNEDMDLVAHYKDRDTLYWVTNSRVSSYMRFQPYIKYLNSDKLPNFLPVKLIEYEPIGIHRESLMQYTPLERFKLYCLNKQVLIFCTNCKQYKDRLKIFQCPNACPKCGAGTLTMLSVPEDEGLFLDKIAQTNLKEKYVKESRIATMFLYNRKYAFYLIAAGFSTRRSQMLLNSMEKTEDLDVFFGKLLDLKKGDKRRTIPKIN